MLFTYGCQCGVHDVVTQEEALCTQSFDQRPGQWDQTDLPGS
jgi:hypothetical protein